MSTCSSTTPGSESACIRYGGTCSALLVGTSRGTVETYVVAGDMTPTWAQGSPACITTGRRLEAILSEVGFTALVAKDMPHSGYCSRLWLTTCFMMATACPCG